MLAAAHGSHPAYLLILTSTASLGAVAICSLLLGFATFVLQYLATVDRRRIVYGMALSARLVNTQVTRTDLHIFWRDKEVSDPHIVEIDFAYRARSDIDDKSFAGEEPFCINVGAPIIDIVDTKFDPKVEPSPRVDAVGKTLRIGPDLLRKGQTITFVVLTDGPVAALRDVNPIINVDAKPEAPYQIRRRANETWRIRQWLTLKGVITWALMAFVVFYVLTEPSGAAGFIKEANNGLHSWANAMAGWVNSI